MGKRRIEITDAQLEEEEISVDFEFDSVLVNFNFKQSDVPMLKKLVADLESEFEDLKDLKELEKAK